MIPWRDVLEFERTAPSGRAKAHAIRERFGCSDVTYYASLNRVLELEVAFASDPRLVARLRRIRDRRRLTRFARRLEGRLPMVHRPPDTQTSLEDLERFVDRARSFEREAGAILGQHRAEAGMALADAAVPEAWKDKADLVIRILAATGREFTAEDVRREAGDPPGHPNAMGARFHAAARARLIRRVGYKPSTRPELHRHPVGVWIGVDVDLALPAEAGAS